MISLSLTTILKHVHHIDDSYACLSMHGHASMTLHIEDEPSMDGDDVERGRYGWVETEMEVIWSRT